MTPRFFRSLAALLVALLASAPAAASDWDCPPDLLGLRKATTSFGTAYVWWCQIPSADPEIERWRPSYALVPNKYRDVAKFAAAGERVASATNRMAAIQAELDAVRVVPPVGSVEEYEFKLLRYQACLEIAKPPHPAEFDPPLPTDWCGAAPVMPDLWRVAKAPWNANPAGERPTYYYANGTFTNSQQRVKEYTPCNPAVARLKIDYTTYCVIQGSTVLYAVAEKAP